MDVPACTLPVRLRLLVLPSGVLFPEPLLLEVVGATDEEDNEQNDRYGNTQKQEPDEQEDEDLCESQMHGLTLQQHLLGFRKYLRHSPGPHPAVNGIPAVAVGDLGLACWIY